MSMQPIKRRQQSGASLLLAVFVLTATALVLALMVTTLSGRSLSTARVGATEQAHFAARAAIEVGIGDALNGNCPSTRTLSDVEGFTVELGCVASPVTEGSDSYTIYELTAVASSGSQAAGTFVTRRLRTTFSN
jgi:hypothetical protein